MPSSVRHVAEVIGADPWRINQTGKTDCCTGNHDSVVGLQAHSHHTYRCEHENDKTPEMNSFYHENQPKEGTEMSSLDALAMACAAEQSAISYVSPKSIMEEPTKLVPEKQQEMAPLFPSNKAADLDCSNHQALTSDPAASHSQDGNRNLNILVASATAAIETEGVSSNIAKEIVVSETKSTDDDEIPKSLTSNLSKISRNDVLCGRGGLTNHHPGNIFFRQLVRQRQEMYLRASKRDKASVAKSIVDTIRNLDPPGRFLKKKADSSEEGVWCEIGNRKAREKTSQALRERAPELREGLFNNDSQSQQQYQGKNLQKSDQQEHHNGRDKLGQEPSRLLIKRRAYALPLNGNASPETQRNSKAISHDVPGVVSRETSTSETVACSNLMVGSRSETGSFKTKIDKDDHLNDVLHHGLLLGVGNDHFKRQKTYHPTSTSPNMIPIPVSPPSSVCNSNVVHAISAVEEDLQSVGFSSNAVVSNQDGTKHIDEHSKRGPRLKMLKARTKKVSEYD